MMLSFSVPVFAIGEPLSEYFRWVHNEGNTFTYLSENSFKVQGNQGYGRFEEMHPLSDVTSLEFDCSFSGATASGSNSYNFIFKVFSADGYSISNLVGCEYYPSGSDYGLRPTSSSGSFHVSFSINSSSGNKYIGFAPTPGSTVTFTFNTFLVNGNNAFSDDYSGSGYLTNGLPVGNVIYFDFGSSGNTFSVDLRSQFTSKSSWFGSTWVNDNRRYGFTDELPTTATNFSESSGSSIPWSPYGSTDLLGRSSEGSATISGTSTGRYLWIINPLYNLGYYDEPDKGTSLNGNIFYIGGIAVDTPYYIYSLKQSATSLGLSSDVASSIGGIGSVTSSGAINTVVNDDSGSEYVPSVGGDNTPPQEVSATEGIKQTLDQFVQMFLNIFTAPISHIQQLISAGSEFISHISGLWAWLPSEVSGFVLSAFVVMVAISIFKLFL